MLKREGHIARLIFLHIQGLADEIQEKELTEWRAESSRHEVLFQRMLSGEHIEKSLSRFVKTEEESASGWRVLQEEMKKRRGMEPVKRVKWFYRVACAIILLLSVGGLALYYAGDKSGSGNEVALANNDFTQPGSRAILILPDGSKVDLENENSRHELVKTNESLSVSDESLTYGNILERDTAEIYHTLVIPRGGEYVLTLSDSTVVYLNADSRLTYPVNFKGDKRKVLLAGEAYFQVKRDEKKPFVVEAQQMEILVLGTTFGVRAYEDEKEIQTTLESGKVLVSAGGHKVNLVPNEQARFDKSKSVLSVEDVDIDLYLAWKDGRLMYDNCPLEKILNDLGRWYAFDVFYSREEARSYQFSVNMKKHEVFTRVLELIEKTGDIQFEIKGKTVIVK